MNFGMNYAILDKDGNVVECDFETWAKWFESADRRVDVTRFECGARVSTVFLGLNHGWQPEFPLWFETMVFGKEMMVGEDLYMRRYATLAEARAGHQEAVKLFLPEWGPIILGNAH